MKTVLSFQLRALETEIDPFTKNNGQNMKKSKLMFIFSFLPCSGLLVFICTDLGGGVLSVTGNWRLRELDEDHGV